MPVNKNFPNYKKAVLTSKVVVDPKRPTTPGPNRASRRREVAEERRRPFQTLKFEAERKVHETKVIRLAKIEARHEENRKRSATRKKVLKENNSN